MNLDKWDRGRRWSWPRWAANPVGREWLPEKVELVEERWETGL